MWRTLKWHSCKLTVKEIVIKVARIFCTFYILLHLQSWRKKTHITFIFGAKHVVIWAGRHSPGEAPVLLLRLGGLVGFHRSVLVLGSPVQETVSSGRCSRSWSPGGRIKRMQVTSAQPTDTVWSSERVWLELRAWRRGGKVWAEMWAGRYSHVHGFFWSWSHKKRSSVLFSIEFEVSLLKDP